MKPIVWIVAVAVAVALCGLPASAQTTAPAPDVVAQIQSLVRDLSADSYQTRQDAQDQLISFGDDAEALLKKIVESTQDAEVRTRAETALAQIEDNRTTGPSMITIHVKDAQPETVLKELSRQAMFNIPTMPENLFKQQHIKWPAVTLDVERQPFLMAFREFCLKANLRPNAMGNDRKFVLMQGGDDSLLGPAVYSGAFMVVANSVTRSASINFARDKVASKNLNIQFTIFAEPKLNILGHDYHLRLSEAIDDKGNSLVIPSSPNHHSMGQDTSCRWSMSASLRMPEDLGTKLVRVRGSNRVLLQSRSETWEVPDISGAQTPSKSIAGRKYVIEDFKANGPDTYQFKFTMIREMPRSEPWQQFGRGVRVTLLDAEGKALSPRGYGGGGSDEKITHTYTFARALDSGQQTGPAAKLVVEVPTEVRDVQVPFEFTDLPLP